MRTAERWFPSAALDTLPARLVFSSENPRDTSTLQGLPSHKVLLATGVGQNRHPNGHGHSIIYTGLMLKRFLSHKEVLHECT